jgi:hypothetical protein
MGQSVFIKKDEKIAVVVSKLPSKYTEYDFIALFKELYPNDWQKIEKRYQQHLLNNKPGKKIPMPKPEKYLLNALKVWQMKNKGNN